MEEFNPTKRKQRSKTFRLIHKLLRILKIKNLELILKYNDGPFKVIVRPPVAYSAHTIIQYVFRRTILYRVVGISKLEGSKAQNFRCSTKGK